MLLQQGRDIFQYGIPTFVTVGIINLFEKVNISDGERKRMAEGLGFLEDLAQLFSPLRRLYSSVRASCSIMVRRERCMDRAQRPISPNSSLRFVTE